MHPMTRPRFNTRDLLCACTVVAVFFALRNLVWSSGIHVAFLIPLCLAAVVGAFLAVTRRGQFVRNVAAPRAFATGAILSGIAAVWLSLEIICYLRSISNGEYFPWSSDWPLFVGIVVGEALVGGGISAVIVAVAGHRRRR